MDKYPKIIIDKDKNSPADIVHAERNYDFIHHTHKMSDIINDVDDSETGGGGSGTDGFSPVVTLSRTENDDGAIISITDINGTKTITVYDGTDTSNKLFEGLDPIYFVVDDNSNLTLSNTVFNELNMRINDIIKELEDANIIDDESNSTDTTWSSSKIQEELDKKTEDSITDHDHDNLDTVLSKLSVDDSNNLKFDNKTLMSTDTYDIDADGKIDSAKTADTLSGLLASIAELNYLQGLKNNIQSQIDAILAGVNFKGEYATFATMQSEMPNPEKGDWVYIVTDEVKNQTNTQYVHDGSNWIYGGGRTVVNEASSTVKGIIQLAGDLTGSASAPQLVEVIAAQTAGYIKSITVDKNGRVIGLVEDATLSQRLADLEARPQIYVNPDESIILKDGDIIVEG